MATDLLYLRDAAARSVDATVTGVDVETLVNAELEADRPIEVSFLDRSVAVTDEDLIRTNVGLRKLTDDQDVRIVEIVGLDKQADGGTHVASTAEVGRIKIVKTESKGKGNKRVRLEVLDS